jgi:hypothetical protein
MGISASKSSLKALSVANYHIVEEKGMALAAEEFLKDSPNGIADKSISQLGRVIFVKRYVIYEPFECLDIAVEISVAIFSPDIARAVFESQNFIERLGDQRGLEIIGMFQRGVIWNNDNDSWKTMRNEFNRGGLDSIHVMFRKDHM